MSLSAPEWRDAWLDAWPDAPANIGFMATARSGGASAAPYDDGHGGGGLNLGGHVGDDPAAVAANRARLETLMPARPAWLNQVHGVAVVDAALQDHVPTADASVSTQAGVACAILTADCLPVLFAAADGSVVGAAHAGWRGLAGGVLGNTVAAMRARGTGEILAWLGPAIGPRRFEVGEDVLAAFPAHHGPAFAPIAGQPGKYLADIYALARLALAVDGVTRVSGGNHCTVSEADTFYSFRRNKITGRQASMIWIK